MLLPLSEGVTLSQNTSPDLICVSPCAQQVASSFEDGSLLQAETTGAALRLQGLAQETEYLVLGRHP